MPRCSTRSALWSWYLPPAPGRPPAPTQPEPPSGGSSVVGRTLVDREPAGTGEPPGDQDTEDEAADLGEEGDAAAVHPGAEEPEVRLDVGTHVRVGTAVFGGKLDVQVVRD